MTFIKGTKNTKEFIEKTVQGRYENLGKSTCESCEKTFNKYHKNQRVCGDVACKKVIDKKKYQELVGIEGAAFRLFSTVRLGKGKKLTALKILKDALDRKCVYCPTIIDLENASVDHKTPRQGSKVYNRTTRKMVYTYEEIKELDRPENLHIICRPCNQLKSDMNDSQYRRFLELMAQDEEVAEIVCKRMRQRIFMFKK